MFSVFIINIIIITISVILYADFLYFLSVYIPKLKIPKRLKVVTAMFGVLTAHTAVIWLFGFAFYILIELGDYGMLQGNFNYELMDYIYFSFTTYTSLGLGDIAPLGDIRFLVGLEALTGLALITWGASFIYIEMGQFWNHRK
jgi:hypothetical protein